MSTSSLTLRLIAAGLGTMAWLSAAEAAEAPAKEGAAASAEAKALSISNGQALQRLMEGNARYVAGKATRPRQDAARRAETGTTQKPSAIVLTCADSRVPPEILFDQGIGDLFVLRVAGNVVDDEILASMEYAVEHLGVSLVVVMGHERCGAVKAALGGGELPGHLPALGERLRPAVEAVKGQEGDALDLAVMANARLTANQVRQSRPILQGRVASGALAVIAARYDLDTGAVTLLW